jgi:hypothetical protein
MGTAKLRGYVVDKQEFRGRLEVGVLAECRNIDEIFAAMSKMLDPTEVALMRSALTKLIGGPTDASRESRRAKVRGLAALNFPRRAPG